LTGSPYFTAWSNQETVWSDFRSGTGTPNVAAGGGGVSSVFSRPAYQAALSTCPMLGTLPVAGINPTQQRMVPDIAVNAGSAHNPNFAECTVSPATNDCSPGGGNPTIAPGGGTSFGAPSFAGVVALMDEVAGGRLGNINPLLYGLQSTAVFHDITTGNNEVTCTPGSQPGCPAAGLYGYPAASGYDCASGLGSPDVYNLLNALATMAPTTIAVAPNPTITTEGTPVLLAATLQVPLPNTHTLGGNVTFAFRSYDAAGTMDLSWTLGSGTVNGGTTTTGTATLSTAVPPGLVLPGMQRVDLVAMYGGDAFHLPSTSPLASLSFGPLNFNISPAQSSVPSGGMVQFSATGGVAPVQWLTRHDTTCNASLQCSTISALGVFTAGPTPGTVTVAGLDADGAEAIAAVTVVASPPDAGSDAGTADAGSADGGSGSDGGSSVDAGAVDAGGSDAGSDAGTPIPDAGGATDSGQPAADAGSGGGKSGGCGCGANGEAAPLAWLLALLGLAAQASRRAARRPGSS
jgi:hypothetical protein